MFLFKSLSVNYQLYYDSNFDLTLVALPACNTEWAWLCRARNPYESITAKKL